MKPARAARLLFHLPSDSRVYVALHPANKWNWNEVLINKSIFLLEILAWQKANEGVKQSKQTEKPEIFIPPFMREPVEKDPDLVEYNTDEVQAILARPRTE